MNYRTTWKIKKEEKKKEEKKKGRKKANKKKNLLVLHDLYSTIYFVHRRLEIIQSKSLLPTLKRMLKLFFFMV